MVTYKCFNCGKQVSDKALDKRFTCQHCNSKIFLKPRKKTVKVKAI
ncbi:MAG: DNA-directed RNA polymerase subunit P [Nanoarchaeota archaeon]|nr:DNA-directed RNA polymerase subunit P [Nanoarchaeota archaeon]